MSDPEILSLPADAPKQWGATIKQLAERVLLPQDTQLKRVIKTACSGGTEWVGKNSDLKAPFFSGSGVGRLETKLPDARSPRAS